MDGARRVSPSLLFRARSGTLAAPGAAARAVALCALAAPIAGAQTPGKVYRIGYLAISPGEHERDARDCPKVGSPYWQSLVAGLALQVKLAGQV